MNLLNPLQLGATLKMKPEEIIKIIRNAKLQSQRIGFRAGLYDLEAVQQAIEKVKSETKTEG